jgi:tripartite-type tricarboxylate transporter receptor subunit TctC
MRHVLRTLTCAALAALALVTPRSAHAQEEGVFARKTITIYVGNTAGGTYDLYGRLAARHLGRFLPGHPSVVVENMPGAGSLRAANFIYAAAAKDGTALGVVTENVAIEQALSNPAVQYDAARFTWVSRVGPSNAIHAMWHTSKVQSIEDAKVHEAALAGTGAGNLAEIIPTLLNALIGTKFKLVRGYPAANEALLAMERGEVEGVSANWTTIKTQKRDWLADHKVKIILQDLPTRGPDLRDTPALAELGDTPDDRKLTGLYASVGSIGRSVFAPPGLPAANAAALRDGFAAMVKDPDFLADADKIGAEVAPSPGADLQKAVVETLALPDYLRAKARAIFER